MPKKFRWKWYSWNYFAMFSTTIGHTATWQCCCGVGGFSTTICRQYMRWDMPLTINCVLLPLDSHVWLTLLSLWADRGFVCRKFLWTFSFWGQWCVSRWKYASRYGRDQHVGCVTYELKFIQHMREIYPKLSGQNFNGSLEQVVSGVWNLTHFKLWKTILKERIVLLI